MPVVPAGGGSPSGGGTTAPPAGNHTAPPRGGTSVKIEEIRALGRQLRALNWSDLEQRIIAATRRDLTSGTRPDGFPRTSGATAPSDARAPTDEDDDDQAVALTSVESAAIARGFHRPERDELHELLAGVTRRLARMADDARVIKERLADIDNLHKRATDPEICESCNRAGVRTDSAYYSDVVGRLTKPMRLCNDCYMHVYRRHPAGAKLPAHEALPKPDRILARHQGRRYREHAS